MGIIYIKIIKAYQSGTNEYLKLPREVHLTNSIDEAIQFAEIIVIAISAQERSKEQLIKLFMRPVKFEGI